jgi:ABC-type phosphate transport system permease subunit
LRIALAKTPTIVVGVFVFALGKATSAQFLGQWKNK